MTTEQLEALSKAATQGELLIEPGANSHCFDGRLVAGSNGDSIAFVSGNQTLDDEGDYHITAEPDAAFIMALWNAYRTGQLVMVDDAAVERVARALAVADGIQICSDAIYALSSYGYRGRAAIAAMGGKL